MADVTPRRRRFPQSISQKPAYGDLFEACTQRLMSALLCIASTEISEATMRRCRARNPSTLIMSAESDLLFQIVLQTLRCVPLQQGSKIAGSEASACRSGQAFQAERLTGGSLTRCYVCRHAMNGERRNLPTMCVSFDRSTLLQELRKHAATFQPRTRLILVDVAPVPRWPLGG
jgi:hypothetical protein